MTALGHYALLQPQPVICPAKFLRIAAYSFVFSILWTLAHFLRVPSFMFITLQALLPTGDGESKYIGMNREDA
jgi:hypothetical protein